jgi:hypothetical protein
LCSKSGLKQCNNSIMHQNSSPISYVPIGVSNRVNVLSNFSVQFWFLLFLLCFGQDYVWLSF